MEIWYRPKFARQYKKIPRSIQIQAERQEKIFRTNPFHPKLKTHKLHGVLAGFYAFSINASYRIIFDFGATKETVHFYEIGAHDIYD